MKVDTCWCVDVVWSMINYNEWGDESLIRGMGDNTDEGRTHLSVTHVY